LGERGDERTRLVAGIERVEERVSEERRRGVVDPVRVDPRKRPWDVQRDDPAVGRARPSERRSLHETGDDRRAGSAEEGAAADHRAGAAAAGGASLVAARTSHTSLPTTATRAGRP